MRPLAQADGHDAPWLIDEAVPGVAAMVHDVIVRGEDAVREPIVAHELPDVLDRIEFRTFGRQRQESDVGRDAEFSGHVPPGLIKHEHGVSAGCDLAADFGEMHVHGLAVATRHDQRGAFAFCGQIAPKIHAEARRRSRGATGLVPRLAQRRVIWVFCPIRASSCHQSSIGVPLGKRLRICARRAGKAF